MFVIVCFATCSGIGRLTARENRTNSMRFEGADFLMTIEWSGAVTKPAHEAAWAATNQMRQMENWKAFNDRYRLTAIVSEQEDSRLEQLFRNVRSLKTGPVPSPQYKQQYVLSVTSGSNAYYLELGFPKTMIPLLEQIKTSLASRSGKPIDSIIRPVTRWKDE